MATRSRTSSRRSGATRSTPTSLAGDGSPRPAATRSRRSRSTPQPPSARVAVPVDALAGDPTFESSSSRASALRVRSASRPVRARRHAHLTGISRELTPRRDSGRPGDAVLVTGATGRLGPQLLAAWRARDPRPLIALVRAPRRSAPARARLAGATSRPRRRRRHRALARGCRRRRATASARSCTRPPRSRSPPAGTRTRRSTSAAPRRSRVVARGVETRVAPRVDARRVRRHRSSGRALRTSASLVPDSAARVYGGYARPRSPPRRSRGEPAARRDDPAARPARRHTRAPRRTSSR